MILGEIIPYTLDYKGIDRYANIGVQSSTKPCYIEIIPPPQVHYGFYQSYMIFGAFHNALDNRWIYLDFRKFDGLEI